MTGIKIHISNMKLPFYPPCEVKYGLQSRVSTRQLAYTTAKISWLWSLFKYLDVSLSTPLIWCDNISSISLASNPVFHACTKHLEVDYHYACDKVVPKELDISYICTTDQVVDVSPKGFVLPASNYWQTSLWYALVSLDCGGVIIRRLMCPIQSQILPAKSPNKLI